MCPLGNKSLDSYITQPKNTWTGERFIKKITARLRHYVAEQQCKWDIYVQLLTYACSTELHDFTNLMPFSLVLSWHPPGLTAINMPIKLLTEATATASSLEIRARLLYFVAKMRQDGAKALQRLPRQEDSQCTTAGLRQIVHVYWLPSNNSLSSRAICVWFVE